MATGFEKYEVPMLHRVRGNLLKGLEKAAEHERAGTLDFSDDPHICPPRAGRDLTVAVLGLLDRELAARNLPE
jgi:hypothetical protein